MTHFDAFGGNDARSKPKILKSWSLWVSIDSSWKDESIELHKEYLAPFLPVENGSRPYRTYVLSADANLLLFDAVAHRLGDDDAQGSVGNVENASSTTVVVLVGHAWSNIE